MIMRLRKGQSKDYIIETNIDLSNATVYVTFSQDGKVIIDKGNDELTINEKTITCKLTQEDTLKFAITETYPNAKNLVSVQVRYAIGDTAEVSDIKGIYILPALKEGVI